MDVEHSVQTLAFMHDDAATSPTGSATWHLDVFPSLYEEDGEPTWDGFEIDVFELLKSFDDAFKARVHVNPEALDMTVSWAGNVLHLVVHFDPPDPTAGEGLAVIVATTGSSTPPNPSLN
jgi:hypothetical protein